MKAIDPSAGKQDEGCDHRLNLEDRNEDAVESAKPQTHDAAEQEADDDGNRSGLAGSKDEPDEYGGRIVALSPMLMSCPREAAVTSVMPIDRMTSSEAPNRIFGILP